MLRRVRPCLCAEIYRRSEKLIRHCRYRTGIANRQSLLSKANNCVGRGAVYSGPPRWYWLQPAGAPSERRFWPVRRAIYRSAGLLAGLRTAKSLPGRQPPLMSPPPSRRIVAAGDRRRPDPRRGDLARAAALTDLSRSTAAESAAEDGSEDAQRQGGTPRSYILSRPFARLWQMSDK